MTCMYIYIYMSHYWTIASACYSHLAGQTPTKPGLAVLVRPTGSQWDEFHDRSRLTGNSWKDSNVCQARRVARMMPLMIESLNVIDMCEVMITSDLQFLLPFLKLGFYWDLAPCQGTRISNLSNLFLFSAEFCLGYNWLTSTGCVSR